MGLVGLYTVLFPPNAPPFPNELCFLEGSHTSTVRPAGKSNKQMK